jgi:hypothetical protein
MRIGSVNPCTIPKKCKSIILLNPYVSSPFNLRNQRKLTSINNEKIQQEEMESRFLSQFLYFMIYFSKLIKFIKPRR